MCQSSKTAAQLACCCGYCTKCRENAKRFKGGYYGLPTDYYTIKDQIALLKRRFK